MKDILLGQEFSADGNTGHASVATVLVLENGAHSPFSERFVIKWFFPHYLCSLKDAENRKLQGWEGHRLLVIELCWYLYDRNSDFLSQHSGGGVQQNCPGSMGNDRPQAFMCRNGTTYQSLNTEEPWNQAKEGEDIPFWQFQGAQPEQWSGSWHLASLSESLVGAKVKCSP